MKLNFVAESGSIEERDALLLRDSPIELLLPCFLAYNRINNKLFPFLTSIDQETRPFPKVFSYFSSREFRFDEFREFTKVFRSFSLISGKMNEGKDCEDPIFEFSDTNTQTTING